MIARPPEKQLSNYSTDKGERGNVFLGGAAGITRPVESLEYGVDLPNDPRGSVSYCSYGNPGARIYPLR